MMVRRVQIPESTRSGLRVWSNSTRRGSADGGAIAETGSSGGDDSVRRDGESLQFTLQWPFCLCRATALSYRKELEARAGIEPAHKGFADLSLTTWVPRLGPGFEPESSHSAVHLVDFCRGGAEWSGRRDLNSRPSPWQGDALPLSYSRLTQIRVYRAAESGSNRQPPPRNGLWPPKLDAFCGSLMRSARPRHWSVLKTL